MKKILIVILLLIPTLLFANVNNQKIYRVDSEVYEAIKYLYVIQGHALPSTTGPWSGDELIKMLDKIQRSNLPIAARSTYDFAQSELISELPDSNFRIDWIIDANLELYAHTNKYDFTHRYDLIYNELFQKPLFNLGFETFATNYLYGYFELPLQNTINTGVGLGETYISNNIPIMQNFEINIFDFDLNFPFRAFASAGHEHWSIQLGRDRLNWGAGETGNLMVGDNLLYNNMLRFTTYFDSFKYTFLTSFFPHPQNYTNGPTDSKIFSQALAVTGLSAFLSHRLEGRFFNDILNITLSESMMYMSETGILDLLFFNPVMFYHNNYIGRMSNSLLSLEIDFTPINGLNIYGQFLMDQMAGFGESQPGKADKTSPNAMGFMLGIKWYQALNKGIFYSSLESVYTTPYLYLRDKGDSTEDHQSEGEYGINFVVAIRNFSMSGGGIFYNEEFLGYKHGGDALVGNFNIGYKEFNHYHIEGNVFFMAHGTHDQYTCWSQITNGSEAHLPTDNGLLTTNHDKHGNHMYDVSYRDSISYTTIIGINGGYHINKSLSIMNQADFVYIENFGNVKGERSLDFQYVFSFGYSF